MNTQEYEQVLAVIKMLLNIKYLNGNELQEKAPEISNQAIEKLIKLIKY